MKELGQKWDMVKLVRDVLFVNVQLTEEESPYSPRRDRLKHQTDSVTCLTKGDESALCKKRDMQGLVGECTYETKPNNKSQSVL